MSSEARLLTPRTGGEGRLRREESGAHRRLFIYVVVGDHNLTKIGVTTNPDARLAQLRTSSPFHLRFAGIASCGRAYQVEARAHQILDAHRLKGEWFDCSPENALDAVGAAAAQLGLVKTGSLLTGRVSPLMAPLIGIICFLLALAVSTVMKVPIWPPLVGTGLCGFVFHQVLQIVRSPLWPFR